MAELRWEDKRKDSDASEIFCHDTVNFAAGENELYSIGFRKSQDLEGFSNPHFSN